MANPVGFMVIRRDADGRLIDDWDGVVHPTQSAANGSCIEAKRDGWDAFTVALFVRKMLGSKET